MKYKRAFDLKIMIQMFIFGENQLLKIVAFHENKSPWYVRTRDLVAGRPKLYPLFTENDLQFRWFNGSTIRWNLNVVTYCHKKLKVTGCRGPLTFNLSALKSLKPVKTLQMLSYKWSKWAKFQKLNDALLETLN